MQLTVISGTNRPGNLSLKVAGICMDLLADLGLKAELLDLALLPREIAFEYVGDGMPDFEPIQALVDRSSHFLFVVPEYNGSYPGILKLFLDACDYPGSFRGKSAAMVGIAAGIGGNQKGLEHLQDVLQYLGMQVHEERLAVAKIRERLHPDGLFADESTAKDLQSLLQTYLKAAQV